MMRTQLLAPLSATFLNNAGSRHGSPRPGASVFMTTNTGTRSGSTKSTTPTMHFLKSTALARIRFFSNARLMTFLTKKPVMP